jgi:glutathione synthase/RimK-type ligase-like ATP-grasp enzyme
VRAAIHVAQEMGARLGQRDLLFGTLSPQRQGAGVSVAFLACPDTLPGSPTRRADAFEHDLLIGALRAGLGPGGPVVVERDWRAPLADFAGVALVLLGTAWDYTDAPEDFVAKLDALAARGTIVCNPAEVVRWNADKLYLRTLAELGAPSIPTIWSAEGTADDVRAAFDAFGCDRVVIKRRVGAGAVGQASFTRAAPPADDWRMGRAAMIQPFLPAIAEEGEYSLIFIDGAFSHGLRKQAAAGDYRIQSLYGGRETAIVPAASDIASAAAVMAMLPGDDAPLYARIDMVRGADGVLALMEAELIEPYLYPEQDAGFGQRYADAVRRRIG